MQNRPLSTIPSARGDLPELSRAVMKAACNNGSMTGVGFENMELLQALPNRDQLELSDKWARWYAHIEDIWSAEEFRRDPEHLRTVLLMGASRVVCGLDRDQLAAASGTTLPVEANTSSDRATVSLGKTGRTTPCFDIDEVVDANGRMGKKDHSIARKGLRTRIDVDQAIVFVDGVPLRLGYGNRPRDRPDCRDHQRRL